MKHDIAHNVETLNSLVSELCFMSYKVCFRVTQGNENNEYSLTVSLVS